MGMDRATVNRHHDHAIRVMRGMAAPAARVAEVYYDGDKVTVDSTGAKVTIKKKVYEGDYTVYELEGLFSERNLSRGHAE